MKRFSQLNKYLAIAGMLILAMTLILWPNLTVFFPELAVEQLIGTTVGLITAAFVILLSAISSLDKKAPSGIEANNLNHCITQISSRKNYFHHLKIFANNSINVLMAFSNSGIHVNKCDLMVRYVEGQSDFDKYNITVKNLVEEWIKLQKEGRIKNLTIKVYDFPPTEWNMIFDNEYSITGLNCPNAEDWKKVRVHPTCFLISDLTNESTKTISIYSERFDDIFRTAKELAK